MSQSSIIIAGVIGFSFNKIIGEIFDGAKILYNKVCDAFYLTIEIKSNTNPKSYYAIRQHILANNEIGNKMMMQDGNSEPNFHLANGNYSIDNISIAISDELISIWTLRIGKNKSLSSLKNYLSEIYKKYNAPSEVIVFYTSEGSNWSFPIFRRPRNIQVYPDHITNVINSVEGFINNEMKYKQDSLSYRYGYFVYGSTGGGKTFTSEIIAEKFHMDVYMVTLNSKDMTDTDLINLLSKVPPRSLIIFEEFDKQLRSIIDNPNSKISLGGILTAIDGPQRLAHGVIVFMTASEKKYVHDLFLDMEGNSQLFRKGRIDSDYYFDQRFN